LRIIAIAISFCFLILSHLVAQDNISSGYAYIFPGPGAMYVDSNSSIILRFKSKSPNDLVNLSNCIKVKGEQSGVHSGKISIASDRQTVLFQPEEKYKSGEQVNVFIDPIFSGQQSNMVKPLNYGFTVRENGVELTTDRINNEYTGQEKKGSISQPKIMSNGVSVPANFPHVTVSSNGDHSNDYVFAANWSAPNYSIIFNTSGEPVWYMKTAGNQEDFKVQANGWITMLIRKGFDGLGMGHVAYTKDFEFIKLIRASNGYTTNMHDFYMLPDNGYILIAQRKTIVDMSEYVTGGHKEASVTETCIQEFTANDELVFIWRSWDHFDIRDLELENLNSNNIRFPHINAVYVDDDGHLLISCRHLSEISKIHRQTGEFIWRWTGIPDSPNNDFNFVNDPLNGFRNQHAIRSLGDNCYTLFDNGNMRTTRVSRAVEYQIDTVRKTATLLWESRNKQDNGIVSQLGNSQKLDNGNTHVNWAFGNIYPIAEEISPNGETLFEMRSENGYRCYRTFRYPWNGNCKTPYLLLEPQVDNVTLLFNKFGDKNVGYYKIYGDTTPNPTTLIDTCHSTLKKLTGLKGGSRYFFRVSAVSLRGEESAYSNEEEILINGKPKDENLIVNGDFARDLTAWNWEVDSLASANVQVVDSVCGFVIKNGGSKFQNISLQQNKILLVQGQDYLLEFDAWAEDTRIVEIEVGKTDSPFNDYSRLGYTALTPRKKRFTHVFKMQESTDNNARLVINAGNSDKNIFIDNLSLKIEVPSALIDHSYEKSAFLLYQNYPNPFKSSTNVEYYLPETSRVEIAIYNSFGQKVKSFVNVEQEAGTHSKKIRIDGLGTGMYFYSLEARSVNTGISHKKMKKMIVTK